MRTYPKIRLTVELLETGDGNEDRRVAVYSYDRGRIAGDVWLNEMTRSVDLVIDSGELFVGVGHEASRCRSFSEMLTLEREKK